jgi:hypothetical protein
MRHLVGLVLITFVPPPVVHLAAQAPSLVETASDSPGLPRFTLREIVAGPSDTLTRIPGRWLKAALAARPESLAAKAYRDAATRGGVTPLQGDVLASERARHVMGLYRRPELIGAIQRTLASIRTTLPSDTTLARFDHLFRSRGQWIVDLHDAALVWARMRVPGLTWESARRSLARAHWLPAGDSVASSEAVPRALYSLTILAANDSAAFEAVRSDLWNTDSASASAALHLLTGYNESQSWYVDALEFFLTEPWIPDQGRGGALSDQVRSYWGGGRAPAAEVQAMVPEIRTRLFGHPQAVPHYGVPRRLFERLVRTDNPSAEAWLELHGQTSLLRALRRLPTGDTSLVLLQSGSEAIRLTTVPRQARESLNGFLEPRDAIAIDPGYSPLLALGAVVHEWQHLLFRQRQLDAFVSGLPRHRAAIVQLPWAEPYLAEGFAEWSTEQILAPLAERWPILSLGELQKRAALAQKGAEDQHVLGYALVRALADAVGDRAVTTDLLVRHAEDPSRLVRHPRVRGAWNQHRTAPDRVFTMPAGRVLIPEVTFTIEDGFPDVIGSRILIPPAGRGQR